MTELSDKELFESAISDAPIVEETPEAPVVAETNDGPVRDEKGRFAPKQAAEPVTEAQPAPVVDEQPAKEEAQVPSWRLRELREAREAAERRAQEAADRAAHLERQFAAMQQQLQQQKPQEPVDPWADLPGYLQQSQSTFEQRLAQAEMRANLRASRAEQIAIHGREAVTEMEKAIDEASRKGHPDLPLLSMQMRNSDDPVGVAMQWYQRDKLVRETGGDLTAFRNRTLEEALKDPAFLAKAVEAVKAQSGMKPTTNTVVQLPPSINRATSAASPHDDAGDLSDASLMAFATR